MKFVATNLLGRDAGHASLFCDLLRPHSFHSCRAAENRTRTTRPPALRTTTILQPAVRTHNTLSMQ